MSTADELKRCLQGLAQPAAIQVSLFPDFAVVGDELALSFDEALTAHRASLSPLSVPQSTALDALDGYLSELSGPHNETFWLDRSALATDPRWQRVRDLARDTLQAFAWQLDVPDRDGSVYISKGVTVRNVDE